MSLPLACSGHLLIDLPIFMGPVVVLAGWLLLMRHKGRRSEERAQSPQTSERARFQKASDPRGDEDQGLTEQMIFGLQT